MLPPQHLTEEGRRRQVVKMEYRKNGALSVQVVGHGYESKKGGPRPER